MNPGPNRFCIYKITTILFDAPLSSMITRPLLAAAALFALARVVPLIAPNSRAEPRAHDAPALRATTAGARDWSAWVALLSSLTGGVSVTTAAYAQCYTGFCTKSERDNTTALCGCLALRPSARDDALLRLGWGAAVLALSSEFRRVAELALAGEDARAERALAAALADGTLWDDYGFASAPARVSLASASNPYWDDGPGNDDCRDIDAAECMGAPCWDVAYEGVWNVTCVCTWARWSSMGVTAMRDDMCVFAKARSADCVAVAGSNANATEYDARALEDMIDAVVSASASLSASIDPASCPATLDGADDFR